MVKESMTELVKVAKESDYTKESVMNIMCICCSEQMHNAGYSSEYAIQKAIGLIKKNKSKADVYDTLLQMSGFDPDEEIDVPTDLMEEK